jgi:predicted DNA-binding transcriptional regulator AlpA
MATDNLINIHEAARISGLSTTTLYKLARYRRLRSFKVLRALRFDPQDVRRLVHERPQGLSESSESSHPKGVADVR